MFSGIIFNNPEPSGMYKMFEEKKKKNPDLIKNYNFIGEILENPESLCYLIRDTNRTMFSGVLNNRPQKTITILLYIVCTILSAAFLLSFEIYPTIFLISLRAKRSHLICINAPF